MTVVSQHLRDVRIVCKNIIDGDVSHRFVDVQSYNLSCFTLRFSCNLDLLYCNQLVMELGRHHIEVALEKVEHILINESRKERLVTVARW